MLDTVKERASHLVQASPGNKDVMEAMKEVEQRHEALAAKTKKNIEDLEWLTDSLTTHQDLSSSQAEWQKEMWEKLHSYTGLFPCFVLFSFNKLQIVIFFFFIWF